MPNRRTAVLSALAASAVAASVIAGPVVAAGHGPYVIEAHAGGAPTASTPTTRTDCGR